MYKHIDVILYFIIICAYTRTVMKIEILSIRHKKVLFIESFYNGMLVAIRAEMSEKVLYII